MESVQDSSVTSAWVLLRVVVERRSVWQRFGRDQPHVAVRIGERPGVSPRLLARLCDDLGTNAPGLFDDLVPTPACVAAPIEIRHSLARPRSGTLAARSGRRSCRHSVVVTAVGVPRE